MLKEVVCCEEEEEDGDDDDDGDGDDEDNDNEEEDRYCVRTPPSSSRTTIFVSLCLLVHTGLLYLPLGYL